MQRIDGTRVFRGRRVGISAISAVVFCASMSGQAPAHTADAAVCMGRTATIVGSGGADRLVGTWKADVIVAGEGDDEVSGLGGNDVICGGPGADRVRGGGGVDRIRGDEGADHLRDSAGPGRDRLFGGAGDDIIRTAMVSKQYRSFKLLVGGPGADVLVSADSSQGDTLEGGAGPDVLRSAGHVRGPSAYFPDVLIGEAGQDALLSQRGGLTDFTLTADGDHVRVRNDGNEAPESPTSVRLSYRVSPEPVTVDLQAGYAEPTGSTVRDAFSGLDATVPLGVVVYGTGGDDLVLGSDASTLSEFLHGRGGDDELYGRAGNDQLYGERGNDLLDGGADSDWGSAGPGDDSCVSMEDVEFCETSS